MITLATAGTAADHPDEARRLAARLLAGAGGDLTAAVDETSSAAWRGALELLSPAVLPDLEYRLRGAGLLAEIPASVAEALQRAARAAVVADLQRRAELQRILALFEEREIAAWLLKGAALANGLYPHPALRPMTDLDIRVRPERIDESARCLLEAGFEIPAGGLAEGVLNPRLSQRRLQSRRNPVLVELHGSVRSLEVLSAARQELCWRCAVDVSVGDRRTKMLSPADAVLHTCLHMAMTNGFAGAQVALLDLRLITTRWRQLIDWKALAADCREQGVIAHVAVALKLAADIAGARVDGPLRVAAASLRDIEDIESLALEQVWEPGPDIPYGLDRILRAPSTAGRLRRLTRRVFVHPWVSSRPTRRTPSETLGTAADRLVVDVTVKAPSYLRAWGRGGLAGARLRRQARLARRRGRLAELVRRAETQLGPGS